VNKRVIPLFRKLFILFDGGLYEIWDIDYQKFQNRYFLNFDDLESKNLLFNGIIMHRTNTEIFLSLDLVNFDSTGVLKTPQFLFKQYH